MDAYRQHRCGGAQREAGEAAAPARVGHPAPAQPRHFAGREHDHALLLLQRLLDRAHAGRRRRAAEDAHRQQQLAQAFQRPQEIVGDDLYVAPHLAHAIQQRQRVQRAGRMVGDDQQAPACRNARGGGRRDHVARLQEIHPGLDQGEAVQFVTGIQERVQRIQARPFLQAAQQRTHQPRAAPGEPVRVAILQTAFECEHGKPLADCAQLRPPQRHRSCNMTTAK